MIVAVVVAQLAERLLPTLEVRGSNSVIRKIYIEHCLLSTVLKRRKKKKRPGMAQLKTILSDLPFRDFRRR